MQVLRLCNIVLAYVLSVVLSFFMDVYVSWICWILAIRGDALLSLGIRDRDTLPPEEAAGIIVWSGSTHLVCMSCVEVVFLRIKRPNRSAWNWGSLTSWSRKPRTFPSWMYQKGKLSHSQWNFNRQIRAVSSIRPAPKPTCPDKRSFISTLSQSRYGWMQQTITVVLR